MHQHTLTGEDGPPLALLLHVSMLLPRQGVRGLEDKLVDVVVPFKPRLPL